MMPGPMAATPAATARAMRGLPDPPPQRTVPALTCFIVEDSPIICKNLIATLEELLSVAVVGTAQDERSALDWMAAQAGPCGLMVIDIFLKSGSGLTVLGRARARWPGAPLVVLSNYATPEVRRRCADLGADRVFDKSSELEELLAYCQTLVDAAA